MLNPSLIQGLGVQTLTCHHLIEVGKGMVNEIESADMIGEQFFRGILELPKKANCWYLLYKEQMPQCSLCKPEK